MSLEKSALDSLRFFDNLTTRIPSYFKKSETVTINPKYNRVAKLSTNFDSDNEEDADDEVVKAKKAKSKKTKDEEDNNAELNMNLDGSDDEGEADEVAVAQRVQPFSVPANFASLNELRDRLKVKIGEQRQCTLSQDEKQIRRKAVDAKQKAQKKQLKENQKKRKVDLKIRLKAEAEEKAAKKAKTEAPTTGGKIVQLSESEAGKIATDPKNITANFTFSNIAKDARTKVVETALGTHKVGSKLQQLKKLSQFKEKVSQLKESGDNEAAEKLIRDKAVETALARAAGEVVKDDENKLKKRIKKAEKKKEKSTANWKGKIERLQKDKDSRIERRDLHIRKKIEEKTAKRHGTFVKKAPSKKGGAKGGSKKGGFKGKK